MPYSAWTSQKLGVSHKWVFCTALCRFSVPLSCTGQGREGAAPAFGAVEDANSVRNAPDAIRAAIGTKTDHRPALSADLPHQAPRSHPQRDEGRGVVL
jgi:hypothetical protein